jgi:hypothetical protein
LFPDVGYYQRKFCTFISHNYKQQDMNRIILLFVLGGFFLTETVAQEIELGGFYGYTFGSTIRTYYGDYKTSDGQNFGGHVGFGLAPNVFVELTYNRFNTDIKYYYNNLNAPVPLVTDYIQIGGVQQIPVGNGNILPYGAVSLGTSVFTVKEAYGQLTSGSRWMLSATLAAGLKFYLGETLGLRLQARMGLPMYFNGLYLGYGGAGASLRVPMIQFDFSAGVFLRLGGAA